MSEEMREIIYNIVTCSPFSNRGRYSLGKLGLNGYVTENLFFNDDELKLYVDSKYREKLPQTPPEPRSTSHGFSANYKVLSDHNTIHEELDTFESDFLDNVNDLLYVLGSAGSGKTTYIRYLLWKRRKRRKVSHNEIFLNLEEAKTEITYAQTTFRLDKKLEEKASWLFCIHLLDTVCEIITKTAEDAKNARKVADCFTGVFGNNRVKDRLDKKYHDVMNAFKDCVKRVNTEKKSCNGLELVNKLYNLKDDNDVEVSIKQVLVALVIFVYCKNHVRCKKNMDNCENMTYIVVDNIESYIKICSNKTTGMYDEDIRTIADAFNLARNYLRYFFELCDLKFQEHFKFIIAMRNSTAKLWENTLHNPKDTYKNVDISGWFDFQQICDAKIKIVLPLIKGNYSGKIDEYIKLFSEITNDNQSKNEGNSFVEMGLEMFNNGIRRATKSFSYIAHELCDILYSSKPDHISADDYYEFWKIENAEDCRYLLRRALFEQIFRSVVSTNNWKNMLLNDEKPSIMSLFQRVLMFLARRTEKYYSISFKDYLSLYNLICGVFVRPSDGNARTNLNDENHFLPLAKILFAMNQPMYDDTRCAPMCVLVLNDDLSKKKDPVGVIAKILSDMWNDIMKESGVRVNDSDIEYQNQLKKERMIRLTKSGFFFIHFISDYSFYLSKSGLGQIPLLYKTDPDQVINAMNSVFKDAQDTINLLNKFDSGFFFDERLKITKLEQRRIPVEPHKGGYLFLHDEKYEESIQQRIIYDHHLFLLHYKRFLDHFGDRVFSDSKQKVVDEVTHLLSKYKKLLDQEKEAGHIDSSVYLDDTIK